MTHTLHGLVIRETEVRENDKFLTVLTPELGKIPVYCYGVRSMKSRFLATTQLFCYNEFVVSEKGDSYTLREAVLLDNFYGLRNSFERLALAQYVLEALCEITSQGNDESAQLRLALNTIYALCYTEKEEALIKGAFELRAASEAGFMPDLGGCALCGGETEPLCLDVLNGHLLCTECKNRETQSEHGAEESAASIIIPLSEGALRGMRYVISAPASRVFSFSLAGDSMTEFGRACERYFTAHIERSFHSLEFYNSLKA